MSQFGQPVDPPGDADGVDSRVRQASFGVSSGVLAATVDSARRLATIAIALAVVVAVVLGGALIVTRQELSQAQERIAALSTNDRGAPAAAPTAVAPSSDSTQASGISPAKELGVALPDGADRTGALLLGDENPADVVEVFVDFQCPFCQRWDRQFGAALIERALADNSDLLVKVVPLAFLGETDRSLKIPGASARAANAVACLAHDETDAVLSAFITSLFATADPSEPPGQFPNDQLQQLAGQAGAGRNSIDCIRAGTFLPYIAAVTSASFARGVTGTPTVLVNGSTLDNPFTAPELQALLPAGS